MSRDASRDPRRLAIAVVAFVVTTAPFASFAQDIQQNFESESEPAAGGICEIDPSACPQEVDIGRLQKQRVREPPATIAVPPWLEGADLECLKRARTRAAMMNCVKPDQVSVRAKPPPRSASDWEVDAEFIRAGAHQSGADVLNVVPGLFVTDRGVPGRAPHLSLRGFEGTSGQDAEIFVGNIPLNQVSHIRAPGYADMRLVMPEVIKAVRVQNGAYDPRQGDFAVAGSLHMDLGLERPGFWAKSGIGSFGGKRVFIAAAPELKHMEDSFVAFASDSTDGPGGNRAGERSSFIGQIGGGEESMKFHATLAIGSGRFDFPGYLPQSTVDRGAYAYGTSGPPGRDRTSQTLIGVDFTFEGGNGTIGLGAFGGKTKTSFHQNLTGYALDPAAGLPPVSSDDSEQVNDAAMAGLSMFYRRGVEMVSRRDAVEVGVRARTDTIDQTDTRLTPDGKKNGMFADATINSTNIAAYVDASIYPLKRTVIRGGTRMDSLSYSIEDRTNNAGVERTAQGFHLGNKAVVDYAVGGGAHLLASYGEGFRSPQVRELAEGERVPFATLRGVEAGVKWKRGRMIQTSFVAFNNWLSHDRVFDAALRQNAEAPPSMRSGLASALTLRSGPFGSSISATYTRARFTGSDARFQDGQLVPYAPAFVARNDAFLVGSLGRFRDRHVMGRLGIGFEGVAGRPLPDGRDAKGVVYVDGVAAIGWKSIEVAVNGTNLLGLRYFDSQYVYASNFDRSPTLGPPTSHVLVAPPPTVFVTLQIHLRGTKEEGDQPRDEKRDNVCLARAKSTADEEECFQH
jgi:iron complex outermembrane receptor protein